MINGISEMFAEEEETFALVPVEVTPVISDDGDVVYRSFENLRLEKNIALPRAVVAALDRDRIVVSSVTTVSEAPTPLGSV